MAPPAERPPSERGVEYLTLDALEELTRKVDELCRRPAMAGHGNWWDVLPQLERVDGRRESLAGLVQDCGGTTFALPMRTPSYSLLLRATLYPDRLELSLQLNGGWVIWQRALFYERPMVA